MKKILLAPFIFLLTLIERIITVLAAVIFAQFPSFLQNYIQRLGGHVDELNRIVNEYTQAALKNSRTLEEYIKIHVNSSVSDFASTGKIMSDNVLRHKDLSDALSSISNSEIYMQALIFIKKVDKEIFKSTLNNYNLSIGLNIESLIYATVGIITSMIILGLIKTIIKRIFKKKATNHGDF